VAAAHDAWLMSGGRLPCVSVLKSVNKAVSGEFSQPFYLFFISDTFFSGAWSRYDEDVANWKTENGNFLQDWKKTFDGPDGWAMTGPLFESAMELCIFTIVMYVYSLLPSVFV
jgi:hypothetical protein